MIENKIINLYSKEIKRYGIDDRRALFWTKNKQDISFNILLEENLKCSNMSILDYGCGVSDLKDFLIRNQYNLIYNGCDINNEFIEEAIKRYPEENIFHINLYKISRKLKITETKVVNFIEQVALVKLLLDEDDLALSAFLSELNNQKQDENNLIKGKLQCYIPNRLLRNYIEAKINAFGNIVDYSFNKDILVFDISVLLQLFSITGNDLSRWISNQKGIFDESEVKKLKDDVLKKDFSIKTIGLDVSKTLLSKFVGKSSDILITSICDLIKGEDQ